MKICHIFEMEAKKAWVAQNFETVEDYGAGKYGNSFVYMYGYEAGGRRLLRCRECGALVMEEYSSSLGDGPDVYRNILWPVADAEEADSWNRLYAGSLSVNVTKRLCLENEWSEYREEREIIQFHGIEYLRK